MNCEEQNQQGKDCQKEPEPQARLEIDQDVENDGMKNDTKSGQNTDCGSRGLHSPIPECTDDENAEEYPDKRQENPGECP